MKKTTLSLAVMAALGASSGAWAGIQLDVLPDARHFIKEAKIDDTNSTAIAAPPIEHASGLQLSAGKQYYIRYKVSGGADFGGTISPTGLKVCAVNVTVPTSLAPTTAVTTTTTTATTGNCDTSSTVDKFTDATGTALVYSITIGTASFAQSSKVFVTGVQVVPKGEVSASLEYGLYDLQGPASSGDTTSFAYLGGETAPYFDFTVSGFSTPTAIPRIPNINVSAGSLQFESPSSLEQGSTDTVPLCQFNINPATATYLLDGQENNVTGATFTDTDTTDSFNWLAATGSYKLILQGDFSAAAAGGIFLATGADGTTACGGAGSAMTLNTTTGDMEYAATSNSTPLTILGGTAGTDNVYVCMTVDGATQITPSAYSLDFVGTPLNTSYENPNPMSGLSIDCAETSKGGSSASIPLVLQSTSAWKQYIRITNPSSIAGNVFLYMYDDAGNIAGTAPSFSLNPGESTGLMFVGDIATAAGISSVNDSGPENTAVAGTTRNKLRLVVEAEFGNPDIGTGVQARSYVLPAGDPATEWGGSTFTQFD